MASIVTAPAPAATVALVSVISTSGSEALNTSDLDCDCNSVPDCRKTSGLREWLLGKSVLGPQAAQALREYSYRGGASPLDRLVMFPFWDWCCRTFIPKWMAPNLITLLGLICSLVPFLLWICNIEYLFGNLSEKKNHNNIDNQDNNEIIMTDDNVWTISDSLARAWGLVRLSSGNYWGFSRSNHRENTLVGSFQRFPEKTILCADSWIYGILSVMIFLYQTFDGIDGKQARRTKTSSPLGQLFDHGCDAFSVTFLSIPLLVASWPLEDALCEGVLLLTYTCFFLLNWRSRHTCYMPFGLFSVTEAVASVYLGYLAMYLCVSEPCDLWKTSILPRWLISDQSMKSMHLDRLFLMMDTNNNTGNNPRSVFAIGVCWLTLSSSYTCLSQLWVVFKHYYYKNGNNNLMNEDNSKVKSSANSISAVIELFQYILFFVTFYVWAKLGVLSMHPWLYFWTQAFVFAGLIHRLIVADVCRCEVSLLPKLLMPLPFILFCSLIEMNTEIKICFGLSMASWEVVMIVLIFEFWACFLYAFRVVHEMANLLKIRVFQITKNP